MLEPNYTRPLTHTITVSIPGTSEKDTQDNLSWILRAFLGGMLVSYDPGAPRRIEAGRVARCIINESGLPEEMVQALQSDCDSYLKEML